MENKIYYLVGAVKQKHPISILGGEVELDLVFADGMIGCCPVFDSKEKAEKYASEKFPIFTINLWDIRKKGETLQCENQM